MREKAEANIGRLAVIVIMSMACLQLFPMGANSDHVFRTVYNLKQRPDLAMDFDTAMDKMDKVFAAVNQPEYSRRYPAEAVFEHRLEALKIDRFYEYNHYEHAREDDVVLARVTGLLKHIETKFMDQPDRIYQNIAAASLNNLTVHSSEYHFIAGFKAVDTDFDLARYMEWVPIHMIFYYVLSFVAYIGMMWRKNLNIVAEVVHAPFFVFLMPVTGPLGFMIYPTQNPKRELARAVNFAATTLSFLMSMSGAAVAQTVKGDAKKKSGGGDWSLQVDSRVSVPLVGWDPDLSEPTINIRGTLGHGKKVFETITIGNPGDFVYNETGVGIGIGKGAYAFGLVTNATGSKTGWAAGIQYYRNFKGWFLGLPVFRVENGRTFFAIVNPDFRLTKRVRLAVDGSFRASEGNRPSWGLGVGIRYTFGSRFVEPAVVANGGTSLRGRLVQNFAF